jgi:hypothetical protein
MMIAGHCSMRNLEAKKAVFPRSPRVHLSGFTSAAFPALWLLSLLKTKIQRSPRTYDGLLFHSHKLYSNVLLLAIHSAQTLVEW